MFGTDTVTKNRKRFPCLVFSVVAAAIACAATAPSCVDAGEFRDRGATATRALTIHYRSHDGALRCATVLLPASYGPGNNPAIPLVISPHGRNATGGENAGYWGPLPAVGGFAVVNPDGMGRRNPMNSFGYAGQIDDLARMPRLVTAALPWLRIDHRRIFALGSSMGGQETLLLVARHPRLLAGAVAMDSVTDLERRYGQMLEMECGTTCLRRFGQPYGEALQQMVAEEVGGTPATKPGLYAARSPLGLAEQIASSGVPLQIWWSAKDRVVIDQAHQSLALFRALQHLDRCAAVSAYVGSWAHSHEMRSTALLPIALARLGLLPTGSQRLPTRVAYHSAGAPCARA